MEQLLRIFRLDLAPLVVLGAAHVDADDIPGIIKLRDGGMVCGTIAELVPNASVSENHEHEQDPAVRGLPRPVPFTDPSNLSATRRRDQSIVFSGFTMAATPSRALRPRYGSALDVAALVSRGLHGRPVHQSRAAHRAEQRDILRGAPRFFVRSSLTGS
jgi:hypothetical protein